MTDSLKKNKKMHECTDVVSVEKRSEIMSKIRSKDSVAEKRVRSVLHVAGYRFRLHKKDLPGTPDIVLPKHRVVIFVHGCFWHQHEKCSRAVLPKSNLDYWIPKLERNKQRFEEARKALEAMGWIVHIVWECETKSLGDLSLKIRKSLRKG